MKKYLAEFIGTFILVFFGTGTAVVLGGYTGGTETGFLGVVAIALAFPGHPLLLVLTPSVIFWGVT